MDVSLLIRLGLHALKNAMIHANSAAAHASESASGKLGKRAEMIMKAFRLRDSLHNGYRMTDREVMEGLSFRDMNSVRPRITELIKSGQLEECGSMRDPDTGKRVRLVRLKQGQQRLF